MTDSDYEQQIYNIYLKHYKEPVSNSDWSNKIQSLPKNYKLKFKDNLWDLSGSFFDNSLYWSKLWVVNPKVENPHLIYKDNSLKFNIEDLVSVNTSEYSVDIQSQFPGLVIPTQESARGALTEAEIPSSLPHLLEFHQYDSEINTEKLNLVDIDREVIVPFYLTDSPPSKDGEVLSKDGYGGLGALNAEQVVVRVDSEVSIGDIFTVFQNRGKVGGFFQSLGISEEEITIKGKIKILSYLPGEDSLYVASIVQPVQSIFAGDFLFRGEPQVYTFSRSGTRGQESGKIIGAPDTDQLLLSLGSILYLDKGLNSGIQAGNLFYIRGRNEGILGIQRPYKYKLPVIGEFKIIHSATNRSTGVIVKARDYIQVGDVFSGEIDQMKDLDQSIDHEEFETSEEEQPVLNTEEQIPPDVETIEDYDTIEQGKDLLIDYEEIEEGEEGGEELEEIEEELEEIEEKDPEEDRPETVNPGDIEMDVEGDIDAVAPEDLEVEIEEEFDSVPLEDIEGGMEDEDVDPKDLEVEEDFGSELQEDTEGGEMGETVDPKDLELEKEFGAEFPEDAEGGQENFEAEEAGNEDDFESMDLEDFEVEGEDFEVEEEDSEVEGEGFEMEEEDFEMEGEDFEVIEDEEE